MKDWRNGIRILLATICIFGAAFLFLGSEVIAGDDCTGGEGMNCPREEWVETPEAQQRTQAGECPSGQLCKQLCITFMGQTNPQDEFRCF